MQNFINQAIWEISGAASFNTQVLLLVSGGSVLEKIVSKFPERIFTSHLSLSVTDERFTKDKSIHNYSTLLSLPNVEEGIRVGVKLIDLNLFPQDKTLELLARRFETKLREWKNENPSGKIVCVVGMGNDAHTLGVFPDTDEERFKAKFLNDSSWVVGYDAGNVSPTGLRVTTTLSFIEKVDKVFMFFEGESKREAFNKIRDPKIPVNLAPAKFIYNLPQTTTFSDLVA